MNAQNKNTCIVALTVAAMMRFGMLVCSAQTDQYLYTGSETTITLDPGIYDITAYGAQGSGTYDGGGGLGAEMEAEFSFSTSTQLTLLVGGAGGASASSSDGGGGGGGSFLIGYGGGGYGGGGGGGVSGGGGGGGGYGGGGGSGEGGGGGGGGSYIDSSGTILDEVSGVASPDDSPNGEIIITEVSEVPEPTTLALVGLSGLSLSLFCRQRRHPAHREDQTG